MGEHSAKFYLRHAGGGCDLVLKRGCLANLHSFTDTRNRRVLIVAGSSTPEALVQSVLAQCPGGAVCRLPAGEKGRGMAGVECVLNALCVLGAGPKDLAVALGGQSVQGTAALAAAIYQGGIDLAACPASTAAQLCACGGALAGVELAKPGCLAGVYKAPALVLVDPALTETEPPAQRAAGLAWALQIALTSDPKLLALLEEETPDHDEILWRTLQNKKNFMDQNPAGQAPALECGTHLAQALWQVYGRRGRRTRGLLPGECLALALEAVIEDKALARRVRALCRKLGLPARAAWNREKVLEALLSSPAWHGGTLASVCITGPGCWQHRNLSTGQVRQKLGAAPQKKEELP